jgi:hypothetical protein
MTALTAFATLVGCLTGLTPVLVGAAAISTVDWRVSGIHQSLAIRRSVLALLCAVGWGVSLAVLLLGSGWIDTRPGAAGLIGVWRAPRPGLVALTAVPLFVGIVPAGLLLVLAWGPSSGSPEQVPTWRTVWHRWVDGR